MLSVEDGASNCIVCREKNNTTIGYLSYLQQSSVIKNALKNNSDCREMSNVYRAVSLKGLTITAGKCESTRVVAHLKQGEHVLVRYRVGRWVRIVSPVQGYAPMYFPLRIITKPSQQIRNSNMK